MRRTVLSLTSVAVALLLACVVSVIGAEKPARAAFPGKNGKIAFQSNRDVASGEIYTITPGGTAQRITFSNGSSDPAYSPDGSRIAYISGKPGGTYQVFVMNSDASGRRQLTLDEVSPTPKQRPTWSPDGTRIAFVANSSRVDGQYDLEIWAINADGSGLKQLTNNSLPDDFPAWSPLGDKIAFVRQGDIWVMNSDGTGQSNITPNSPPGCSPNCYQGGDGDPAWSPDGSKIAYVHGNTLNGGGLPDIWTMDPNGSGKTNVSSDDSRSDTEPAWSPDGSKIAMVGATDTNRDMWVMNADGSGATPIDTNPAHDINPDWQPIPQCNTTDGAPNSDLAGTSESDNIRGTAGNDVICGLDGDDTINGLGGNDIILGGSGNDKLTGDLGNDTLNGGRDTDTVLYSGSTGVIANLTTEFARGVGLDVLLGIENLSGSSEKDTLTGSASTANVLKGLGGNDVLNVRDGTGNDTADGGTGTDTCKSDAADSIRSCER